MNQAFATCLSVLLLCACGSESTAAKPSATTSGAESAKQPAPLPAPYDATFVQPVHIPLSLLEASINSQLPETLSHPRSLITRENQSPSVEASYEVWRDPVSTSFDAEGLHVDVPLRYAARFGVRIKNPFGGKWFKVADNADWGTADDPQRVTLRVNMSVGITPDWQLQLGTEVEPPQHGPPPDAKLCTSGSFKLCVGAETLAPEVRRRLDAEIVPRVRAELEKLEERIVRTVDLRARTERIWQQVAQPRALGEHDRFSVIEPRQAALELRAEGTDIVVEPAIEGRVTFHQGQPSAAAVPPLPERRSLAELPGKRVEDARVFSVDLLL